MVSQVVGDGLAQLRRFESSPDEYGGSLSEQRKRSSWFNQLEWVGMKCRW